MGRRRNRGGWSLGTIVMLTITGLVIAGCVLLYPKLTGDIDLRVNASEIAVAFDNTLRDLRGEATIVRATENTPLPSGAFPGAGESVASPIGAGDLSATDAPTATPAPVTRTFTLTAGGSVSADSAIQKACTTDEGYRFDRLFEQLAPALQSDLNIVTLENTTIGGDKLTDVNAPVDLLSALLSGGFNTVCVGFYGALNGGIDGLNATLGAIGSAGMTPYGLYPTEDARNHPTIVNAGGVNVALLSYQNELSNTGRKRVSKAEQAFVFAQPKLPAITADIAAAKAAGAQVVIVSLCWGKEGASKPTNVQRELAQSIADAGADVILGTHSGALQPVELLTAHRADGDHQALCAYSLGNLLSSDRDKRATISGALLHMTLSYRQDADSLLFTSLEYTPTYAWRGKEDGRTSYRVLRSNAAAPDYVDTDQQKVMGKCLELVRDMLKSSPMTETK